MPLLWGSRKQDGTALHTQDAEYVSAATWTRTEVLALQTLYEALLGRPVKVIIMEDNEACITAVLKGYSPSLRHLRRNQRICLGFLHDLITETDTNGSGKIKILHAETAIHKGDMFTKYLVLKNFKIAMQLINMHNRREGR